MRKQHWPKRDPTESPLVAYKGHPIIVPFAESRFLMTGIFIYHICFITLSKSTICQCMTN